MTTFPRIYKSYDKDCSSSFGFGYTCLLFCVTIFALGPGSGEVHSLPTDNDATSPITTTTSRRITTTAMVDRDWELIKTYPHDRTSFTQGLEVHPSSVVIQSTIQDDTDPTDGSCEAAEQHIQEQEQEEELLLLTESTGMHGDSLLRIWDPSTGVVHRETKMDSRFFAEGSTLFVDASGNEKIAVLTYQEGSILVYDAHTLQLIDTIEEWPSPTTTREGWGIAFDPFQKIFCVTDGSEYLHFWNLKFEEIPSRPKVPVRIEELVVVEHGISQVLIPRVTVETANANDNGPPPGKRLGNLNELEWDASTNTLLANKWFEEIVIRIDPTTGAVLRIYDFSSLYPKHSRTRAPGYHTTEDVFNGIAIIPNTDGKEWLVTGKYWPNLYRVRIRE